MRLIPAALVGLLVGAPVSAPHAQSVVPEEVDLKPTDRVVWGLRNVGIGFASLAGGWDYWYGDRSVTVETVPADADVALYYIRSNFQKNYERVAAPVIASIPARVETTPKDSVRIRVLSDGYLTKEASYAARDIPEKLVISLDPLPNSLTFIGATHLAGRTSMTFRTTEEPDLRVGKARSHAGFQIALTQTADKLEPREIEAGWVRHVEVTQLGEDVVVRVDTTDPDLEVRSKKAYDPVRREHVYVFDLLKKGTRVPSASQIRRELDNIPFVLNSCSARFAGVFRAELDAEAVARAFRKSGGLADLYRREAMKRLGRIDRGRVRTLDGEELRTGSPIELELALQSAAEVKGYLGMLGAYARSERQPRTAMRSLVAPELGVDEFAKIWERAENARRSCAG